MAAKSVQNRLARTAKVHLKAEYIFKRVRCIFWGVSWPGWAEAQKLLKSNQKKKAHVEGALSRFGAPFTPTWGPSGRRKISLGPQKQLSGAPNLSKIQT